MTGGLKDRQLAAAVGLCSAVARAGVSQPTHAHWRLGEFSRARPGTIGDFRAVQRLEATHFPAFLGIIIQIIIFGINLCFPGVFLL